MPLTKADRKRRDEVKLELVEMVSSNKFDALNYIDQQVKNKENKQITAAVRGDVLAMCLDSRLITTDDIPAKLAEDVALRFLKDAPWRERDVAADQGTRVHKLAELLSQGEIVEVPDELRGHVNVWYKFVSYYDIEFVETEFTVFDLENDFAGCGDFIAYFHARPEWGLVLGDYKTSKSGIYGDIALQLAALRFASFIARCQACAKHGPCKDGKHPREALWEDRSTLPKVKTTVGVQLTADAFHVVKVRAERNPHLNIFLSGRNVAKWKTVGEQMALDTESEQKVMVEQ